MLNITSVLKKQDISSQYNVHNQRNKSHQMFVFRYVDTSLEYTHVTQAIQMIGTAQIDNLASFSRLK